MHRLSGGLCRRDHSDVDGYRAHPAPGRIWCAGQPRQRGRLGRGADDIRRSGVHNPQHQMDPAVGGPARLNLCWDRPVGVQAEDDLLNCGSQEVSVGFGIKATLDGAPMCGPADVGEAFHQAAYGFGNESSRVGPRAPMRRSAACGTLVCPQPRRAGCSSGLFMKKHLLLVGSLTETRGWSASPRTQLVTNQ